ncbi:hypothetical protein [Dyadobacter sp. 32]|uniref:hypothetical protein n=1 Tax=Dyadobacter sp. 32 TaxID=538966 RepID=UPI0011EBBAA7
MGNLKMPENGDLVRFRRNDEDDDWKQGEYDEQNGMFIEVYSSELVTHNAADIKEWALLEV